MVGLEIKKKRKKKFKNGMNRELSSVLCGDLEGWNGAVGGRFKREEIYVYMWQIHIVMQ